MAQFNEWVTEKWNYFSWTGPKKAPYGELLRPSTLPSVDYSIPKEKSITTTIDCYVTGSYIDQRGKMFTIRERYSIDVTYSNSTVLEAMARIRQLLMSKFEEENPSFQVGDVFIPELPPEMKVIAEPQYVYRGGRIYRYMTRLSEGRIMLETEKDIYVSRAESIIKRYGLKRREGLIRRL